MTPIDPPDVEQLKARKNRRALVEALAYRPDLHLRLAAALALEELGWQPAGPAEAALYAIAKGKFSWCLTLGAPAADPLIAALPDPDERVRRQALLALGKLAAQLDDPAVSAAAANAAAPLLLDGAEGVNAAARTVLAALGETGSAALCETVVEGQDTPLRLAALSFLADGGPQAQARLLERIRARSYLLQTGDLKILGETRDPRWLPALTHFLQDPDNWPARAAAADALAALGEPRAADALLAAYYEACAACDQLANGLGPDAFELARREARKEAAAQPSLTPQLALLLEAYRLAPPGQKPAGDASSAAQLLSACAQALTRLGGETAAGGFILALRLPAARPAALRGVGALREKRAVPALRALLSSPDRALRREAEALLVYWDEKL